MIIVEFFGLYGFIRSFFVETGWGLVDGAICFWGRCVVHGCYYPSNAGRGKGRLWNLAELIGMRRFSIGMMGVGVCWPKGNTEEISVCFVGNT